MTPRPSDPDEQSTYATPSIAPSEDTVTLMLNNPYGFIAVDRDGDRWRWRTFRGNLLLGSGHDATKEWALMSGQQWFSEHPQGRAPSDDSG